jgi:hypothetical protein
MICRILQTVATKDTRPEEKSSPDDNADLSTALIIIAAHGQRVVGGQTLYPLRERFRHRTFLIKLNEVRARSDSDSPATRDDHYRRRQFRNDEILRIGLTHTWAVEQRELETPPGESPSPIVVRLDRGARSSKCRDIR